MIFCTTRCVHVSAINQKVAILQAFQMAFCYLIVSSHQDGESIFQAVYI